MYLQVDILEAITTYMYNGAVSVPHHKLQVMIRIVFIVISDE